MKLKINCRCPSLVILLFIPYFSLVFQPGQLYSSSLQPAAAGIRGKTSGLREMRLRYFLAGQNSFDILENQATRWFPGINLKPYLSGCQSGLKALEPKPSTLTGLKKSALFSREDQLILAAGFAEGEKKEAERCRAKLLSGRQTTRTQGSFEKVEAEKSGKKDEKEQVLKPEFANIREQVGVYAFVVWMWLVIAVLLYVLREQGKEADRRHRLKL